MRLGLPRTELGLRREPPWGADVVPHAGVRGAVRRGELGWLVAGTADLGVVCDVGCLRVSGADRRMGEAVSVIALYASVLGLVSFVMGIVVGFTLRDGRGGRGWR